MRAVKRLDANSTRIATTVSAIASTAIVTSPSRRGPRPPSGWTRARRARPVPAVRRNREPERAVEGQARSQQGRKAGRDQQQSREVGCDGGAERDPSPERPPGPPVGPISARPTLRCAAPRGASRGGLGKAPGDPHGATPSISRASPRVSPGTRERQIPDARKSPTGSEQRGRRRSSDHPPSFSVRQ